MLRFDSKNVNYSAASIANDTQVAYFNANRNNNRCDINITIENIALYLNNLNAFENDFTDFMAEVSALDD